MVGCMEADPPRIGSQIVAYRSIHRGVHADIYGQRRLPTPYK